MVKKYKIITIILKNGWYTMMVISNLKVLISDDSILVRKQFIDMLTSMGCTNIFNASNGQDAIDMYKENNPDLVFMDIIMPVKSGIEALKEITNFNPKAKVVIASSAVTQNYLKLAIEAGAYDFLQKPISVDHIKRIIDKVIKDGE